jgi:hypothetical protein
MSANGSSNGQNGSASGDGGGRKRRNRKRRNRSTAKATAEFWGDSQTLPEPRDDIRITSDPSAVVRSLGRPPLPGQEQASEAYFAAVYARAVGLASALAAAGELIEPEELLEG